MEGAANGSVDDRKIYFRSIYSQLKSELLENSAFDFTDDAREWIDKVRTELISNLTILF